MRKLLFYWLLALLLAGISIALLIYYLVVKPTSGLPTGICKAPFNVVFINKKTGDVLLKGAYTFDLKNKQITYAFFRIEPDGKTPIFLNRKAYITMEQNYPGTYDITINKVEILSGDTAANILDRYFSQLYVGSTYKFSIKHYRDEIYAMSIDKRVNGFCSDK